MTEPAADPRARPRWTRLDIGAAVVFGLLAAFHCVAVLGFVASKGHLSMVPIYDDVSYLTDGLLRMPAFEVGGIASLARSFAHQAPHAPYSTLLAVGGFAITPGSAFGSYALNVLWIAAFVALAWRILSGLAPAARFGLLAAALSVPMLATVIGSFRPDVFWGLLTGGMAVILAAEGIARTTRAGVFVTGLVVGVVALTKPTGMPAGSIVMAVGYLGGVAVDLTFRRLSLSEVGHRTLVFLAGVVAIVTPYLIFGGHDLLKYILDVMVHDAGVWRTNGTLATHLLFFLQPELTSQWLGWALFAAPALLLGGLAVMLWSGRREEAARGAVVILAVLMSYAIPSWSPVKIGFFGSILYGTVISAGLWGAARGTMRFHIPSLVLALAGLIVFALAWRPGNETIASVGASYTAIDNATRAIAPAVTAEIASAQDTARVPIFITTSPGPIYAGTLEYDAALHNLKGVFVDRFTNTNWDQVRAEVEDADIVSATQDGADGQDRAFPFPMLPHQADIIAALSNNPAWRTIATYVDAHGFKTIAFSKLPAPSNAKLAFGDGFQGESPAWHSLPRFHWMTSSPAALTVIGSSGPLPAAIRLNCDVTAPSKVTITGENNAVLVESDLPASAIGEVAMQALVVPLNGSDATRQVLTIAVAQKEAPPPGWPGPMLCASTAVRAKP